jgi:hypothetical protein
MPSCFGEFDSSGEAYFKNLKEKETRENTISLAREQTCPWGEEGEMGALKIGH